MTLKQLIEKEVKRLEKKRNDALANYEATGYARYENAYHNAIKELETFEQTSPITQLEKNNLIKLHNLEIEAILNQAKNQEIYHPTDYGLKSLISYITKECYKLGGGSK